jgi:hypothetical protein
MTEERALRIAMGKEFGFKPDATVIVTPEMIILRTGGRPALST